MSTIYRQVPLDHPAFPGHFPGQPVVPGVVLLDWVLQALMETDISLTPEAIVTFQVAKFLSPVRPGETLRICLTPGTRQGWCFEIRSDGGGERSVATGSLSVTNG